MLPMAEATRELANAGRLARRPYNPLPTESDLHRRMPVAMTEGQLCPKGKQAWTRDAVRRW